MSTDAPSITDELMVAADLLEESGYDRAAKVLRVIPDRNVRTEPLTARDMANAIRRSRQGTVFFADTLDEDIDELARYIDRTLLLELATFIQWGNLNDATVRAALESLLPQHLRGLLQFADVQFIDDPAWRGGEVRLRFDNRHSMGMRIDRHRYEEINHARRYGR